MIVQIDTSLEMCIDIRFEHIDNQIKSASWIARLIRNAFAHDPFNPKWLIDRKCKNNTYEIENIIKISTNTLHNKRMKREDYGGPLALLKFSEFVHNNIVKAHNKPNETNGVIR